MASKDKSKSKRNSERVFPDDHIETLDGSELDLSDFSYQFRRKAQANLNKHVEKVTFGDFVKIVDLERQTKTDDRGTKQRELRVVWINRKAES